MFGTKETTPVCHTATFQAVGSNRLEWEIIAAAVQPRCGRPLRAIIRYSRTGRAQSHPADPVRLPEATVLGSSAALGMTGRGGRSDAVGRGRRGREEQAAGVTGVCHSHPRIEYGAGSGLPSSRGKGLVRGYAATSRCANLF